MRESGVSQVSMEILLVPVGKNLGGCYGSFVTRLIFLGFVLVTSTKSCMSMNTSGVMAGSVR